MRTHRAAASAIMVCALVAPSYGMGAAPMAVIYETDAETGSGIAHLERVPASPKALRGLIAMYALQAGGDCDHHDELGLRCTLTTALGLGSQCSDAQLKLVASTFPDAIPIMNWSRMGSGGKAIAACYEAPDTASVQLTWTLIRMSVRGETVRISANASRLDQADCSFDVRFESVYRVHGEVAEQLSSRVTPKDWTGRCPSH